MNKVPMMGKIEPDEGRGEEPQLTVDQIDVPGTVKVEQSDLHSPIVV
jgi:hypothetical protein